MKRLVIFFLLAVTMVFGFFSAALHAESLKIKPISISSSRTNALGGFHAALGDDLSTLFSNPAGFQTASSELSLSEIDIWLTGPIFDISGLVIESVGGDITQLLSSPNVQSLLKDLYAATSLTGPIHFGYIGNGLGFGFFNQSDVVFSNAGSLSIKADASESLMLCGGYSFRIPLPDTWKSDLDVGLMLKGGLTGRVVITRSYLQLPSMFSNITPDFMLGEPFHFISQIGLDAGIRYAYNDIFALGVVVKDAFTPYLRNTYSGLDVFLDGSEAPKQVNGRMPLNLSAGIFISPPLGRIEQYISNLKIMLDYNDILDFLTHPSTSKNPLLNIGAGMELVLLDILSLRGGFYQGMLSAGLGLDLKYFQFNLSMFGRELSSEPGRRPMYNMQMGFSFRL